MSSPSDQLQHLIDQFKNNEITADEFERRSSELIEGLGKTEAIPSADDVQLSERFRTAERIVRNL